MIEILLVLAGQASHTVGATFDKLEREISERVRACLHFVGLAHAADLSNGSTGRSGLG
jgi:hypothetical protein